MSLFKITHSSMLMGERQMDESWLPLISKYLDGLRDPFRKSVQGNKEPLKLRTSTMNLHACLTAQKTEAAEKGKYWVMLVSASQPWGENEGKHQRKEENTQKRVITCHYCKKPWHWARKYRKKKADECCAAASAPTADNMVEQFWSLPGGTQHHLLDSGPTSWQSNF